MSTIKRVDGFGCDESCFNYRKQNGLAYCRSTKKFTAFDSDEGWLSFRYELIPVKKCPLERV